MLHFKASDNLKALNAQIVDLVPHDVSVIEVGCGAGELLNQLAPKIGQGVGLDTSKRAITKAVQLRGLADNGCLDFQCRDLAVYRPTDFFDVSIASLFFHTVPISVAKEVFHMMQTKSNKIVICGFSDATTWKQRLQLWVDQRLTPHYGHFKAYQHHGGMNGLIQSQGLGDVIVHDTHIPFVSLYEIDSRNH